MKPHQKARGKERKRSAKKVKAAFIARMTEAIAEPKLILAGEIEGRDAFDVIDEL